MMIKLASTVNNLDSLLSMAHELNAKNGSEDWVRASINPITLNSKVWDYQDDILKNYKDTFGDDAFDDAINAMDVIYAIY